jgi:hypothetical protein
MHTRSQHNTNLIFNTVHFYCRYMLKFCVENFHNLEKSMSYAFSISHVGEPSGQNQCASGTRNIESNTHGLRWPQPACQELTTQGEKSFWNLGKLGGNCCQACSAPLPPSTGFCPGLLEWWLFSIKFEQWGQFQGLSAIQHWQNLPALSISGRSLIRCPFLGGPNLYHRSWSPFRYLLGSLVQAFFLGDSFSALGPFQGELKRQIRKQ